MYVLIFQNQIILKLGSVAGPVIQANGRLSFEDDLRSGGLLYHVFHSEPASALRLLTVWSLWGTQGWLVVGERVV